MARVRDLWHVEVKDPDDPTKKIKQRTSRHPDRGGSKDAKRWLACWIDTDGKEKTKAFRIQDAAKKYARKQEEDVERGEYIDPDAGKELFGPLAKKWLRLRDVGASSRKRYDSVYRHHVEPVFGERQVQAVKPSEVLEWMRALSATHGHATQENAYLIARGVFDLAVADGMRKDNPVRSPIIPKPHKEPRERPAWPVSRVWAVIDAHAESYRLIPLVSAACGLRQSEALALAEEDFDFEAGKLHIRRQVVRIGKLMVFKLPKGGKARTAPLSSGVARAVRAHIEACRPRPYELPWMGEKGEGLAADPHVCKLMFRWQGDDARTHDQHIRESTYNRSVWQPALAAAEVIPPAAKNATGRMRHQGDPDNGTHVLRHYCTTTLLDAGVSLAGVMEFLGHSRKGKPVTLGVYAHVTEETLEAARNAIDRSLFRLRAVKDQLSSGTETEQAVSG